MAEELVQQIATLNTNVQGLKIKADKVDGLEGEVKAAKLTADEAKQAFENAKLEAAQAKQEAANAKAEVETLKAWQVKKDAADTANQEALNEIIASRKNMKISGGQEKSFAEVLQETIDEKENKENFTDWVRKGSGKCKMQLKAVGDMSFGANFSTANISVTTLKPGIIMQPNRKVHIRQLVPTANMTGSSITYIKEGAGEGAPAAVAEGALKPQFDLDLTEGNSQAQYIAGWMRMSRKLLDDVQGMVGYLNARLPEKLLQAEDAELLSGSGVSPHLSGLLTAGNSTATGTTSTILIERLIDSIYQLEENNRNATAMLVRPKVYGELFKNKAAGSGEYDLPSNVTFVNGILYVGGVPTFASTGMLDGKFIVGDFAMGAQLFIREAPSIIFAYEDGINIRENMVTVRIEERVAFPIYGSDYFITGNLAAA